MAIDSGGNVYVAGRFHDRVFRVTPQGVVSVWFDAADSGGLLNAPAALAVDSSDVLYAAGGDSDDVWKVTVQGQGVRIADPTGDGAGNPLNDPRALAVATDGTVYVSGGLSDNVLAISAGGVVTEVLDSTGDGAGGSLDEPHGLAIGADGSLYVAGRLSNNVFRLPVAGPAVEIVDSAGDGGTGVLTDPVSVAVDAAGRVYVAGRDSDNVLEVDGAAVQVVLDVSADGSTPLDAPFGLALDAEGTLYVTGSGSDNVFLRSAGGATALVMDAAGDGSGAVLSDPRAIIPGSKGVVYVVGRLSSNLFAIVPECGDGLINGLAGENCEDGGTASFDGCSATCEVEPCYACSGDPSVCVTEVRSGCAGSGRGSILLKEPSGLPTKNKLVWVWQKADLALAEIGDPVTATGLEVCAFDGSRVVMAISADAGGQCGNRECWKAFGPSGATKGYKYSDSAGSSGGLLQGLLKAGVGSGKILFKARKDNLRFSGPAEADAYLASGSTLRVQARRTDDSTCWETLFDAPRKNTAEQYRAVAK